MISIPTFLLQYYDINTQFYWCNSEKSSSLVIDYIVSFGCIVQILHFVLCVIYYKKQIIFFQVGKK